jgi:hypothetical protein
LCHDIGGIDEDQCSQSIEGQNRRSEEGYDNGACEDRRRRADRHRRDHDESVDELKLAAGQAAYAVVKASDVMVAID